MFHYKNKLKPYSQDLRKNMMPEERRLWYEFIRDLPVRFHRQKMIGQYILDFYCASHKFAIEVDGSQHGDDAVKAYDDERSKYLSEIGITVLRYTNSEINSQFDAVCADIMEKLGILP